MQKRQHGTAGTGHRRNARWRPQDRRIAATTRKNCMRLSSCTAVVPQQLQASTANSRPSPPGGERSGFVSCAEATTTAEAASQPARRYANDASLAQAMSVTGCTVAPVARARSRTCALRLPALLRGRFVPAPRSSEANQTPICRSTQRPCTSAMIATGRPPAAAPPKAGRRRDHRLAQAREAYQCAERSRTCWRACSPTRCAHRPAACSGASACSVQIVRLGLASARVPATSLQAHGVWSSRKSPTSRMQATRSSTCGMWLDCANTCQRASGIRRA